MVPAGEMNRYPDLIRKYLGSVVPVGDNYFAALNSAVFTDGSFCYIPEGVNFCFALGMTGAISEGRLVHRIAQKV